MKYYRIHTADIAWITQQPRGIFTTVGKLVDAETMTAEEIAEYWRQRAYFEERLPVPPFYEQDNNARGAITWFKDNEAARGVYEEMTFYRAMLKKYGVKLYVSECEEAPGEVIYEDEFQIAVINQRPDAVITCREAE